MTATTRRPIQHAATQSGDRHAPQPAIRDWRHQAECRKHDGELWFPVGISGPAVVQAEKAKEICASCPVRKMCLQWATDTVQDSGVWGGLTEQERSLLRRPSRTRMQYANGALRHVQILRHDLARYLDLAAGGLTVEEIAAEMNASAATIRKVKQTVDKKTWTVSA